MSHMAIVLVAEVAAQYGVSKRTVHRMIDRGELTPENKLRWDTGPYLLDPDHVAAVFARRNARAATA